MSYMNGDKEDFCENEPRIFYPQAGSLKFYESLYGGKLAAVSYGIAVIMMFGIAGVFLYITIATTDSATRIITPFIAGFLALVGIISLVKTIRILRASFSPLKKKLQNDGLVTTAVITDCKRIVGRRLKNGHERLVNYEIAYSFIDERGVKRDHVFKVDSATSLEPDFKTGGSLPVAFCGNDSIPVKDYIPSRPFENDSLPADIDKAEIEGKPLVSDAVMTEKTPIAYIILGLILLVMGSFILIGVLLATLLGIDDVGGVGIFLTLILSGVPALLLIGAAAFFFVKGSARPLRAKRVLKNGTIRYGVIADTGKGYGPTIIGMTPPMLEYYFLTPRGLRSGRVSAYFFNVNREHAALELLTEKDGVKYIKVLIAYDDNDSALVFEKSA